MIPFVDVSHHDRDRLGRSLDWARIFAATSPVMIAKVSEGDPSRYSFTDPYGVTALRDANAAGARVAAGYHCPLDGDAASVARQVDYLRGRLDLGGASGAMLDVEPFAELGSAWPRWATVLRWRDRWAKLESRPLLGYIPEWFWAGGLGSPNLRDWPWPIIASSYGSNPVASPASAYAAQGGDGSNGWDAYGGRAPELLQFGSRTQVPGASSSTDCSAWRGSLSGLVALMTGGTMAFTSDELAQILNTVWHGDIDSGGRSISGGTALLSTFDQVTALTSTVAAGNAANAARDATTQAAITALANVISAGGGSVDSAAIIAAINEAAESTGALVGELHAQLAQVEAQNVDLRQRLAAGARAESDALSAPPPAG